MRRRWRKRQDRKWDYNRVYWLCYPKSKPLIIGSELAEDWITNRGGLNHGYFMVTEHCLACGDTEFEQRVTFWTGKVKARKCKSCKGRRL